MVEFGRQVARVGEGVAAAADQGLAGVAQQETSLAVDGLDIALRREQQFLQALCSKTASHSAAEGAIGTLPGRPRLGIVRERGRLAGHGAKPQHLTHQRLLHCNTLQGAQAPLG